MRVMVIVKASKSSEAGVLPSQQLLTAMGQYNESLAKAALLVGEGAGLKPSTQGARIMFSGKNRTVTDGPFAETKELIAGFWIWKVSSMQEAIEWARKCPNPMPEDSELEIRPFYEFEDFGEVLTPAMREQEVAAFATGFGLPFPRFEDRREMLIGGLNASYTKETRIRIPQQWDRFGPHIGKVPGQIGSDSFGVCWNCKPNCDFEYLTGVEITDAAKLPADFVSVKIPAGRYVVFTHTGHISAFPKMIDTVWSQWVPKSELKISPGPCFERYTPEFNPRTGLGGVEFWVPIAA
jgi:AraC family transcriptional regulator